MARVAFKGQEADMVRRAAVILVSLLPLLSSGCTSSETAAQDREGDKKTKPRDEFAADQAMDLPKPAPFDAQRAMKYLRDLCGIGPRISGSAGMDKQRALLKEHFEKLGATVALQEFAGKQASQPRPIPMANMIVTWRPESQRRIILAAHYDTRPLADQEPDRRMWTRPFVSANDGTSGVAWLMELAHHMKDLPLNVGVDFIIFDGEECIYEPGQDKFFLGSQHFAADYRRLKPRHRYIAGVLLDLFAGKGATIPIEGNSRYLAGAVVEDIWKTAAALGVTEFKNQEGHTVDDDHLALNNAGIPTVDIVDFDYPHWHRLSDVPENCSADSMAFVARVLTVWLQHLK
jgi:glutaminyl-peptide cyclotransferase